MNKETARALEKSIEHWEQNLAADDPYLVSTGTLYCALCLKFHSSHRRKPGFGCSGCPVQEHTGRKGCGGTPYEEAETYLRAWRSYSLRGLAHSAEKFKDDFRRAAQAEVEFLKSLRDPN